MSRVYLKQSRNRLPCRHILLRDTAFIIMNSFPSLCLLDSLCQLCTHSKRQQSRGLFHSWTWPEKTRLISLSGHLNWTEAEFSSATVGQVFYWHPNVPECFVCFAKVHLKTGTDLHVVFIGCGDQDKWSRDRCHHGCAHHLWCSDVRRSRRGRWITVCYRPWPQLGLQTLYQENVCCCFCWN